MGTNDDEARALARIAEPLPEHSELQTTATSSFKTWNLLPSRPLSPFDPPLLLFLPRPVPCAHTDRTAKRDRFPPCFQGPTRT